MDAGTVRKQYAVVTIAAPGDLSSPFNGGLYPCLIWDHGSEFTREDRAAVARVLLDSGCRYAVCGGKNCRAWAAAVDIAFVTRYQAETAEFMDTVHVMTTSHDGESPDDVAFFFVNNTDFDYHEFRHYLILHVGRGDASRFVEAAVQHYATDGQAPRERT